MTMLDTQIKNETASENFKLAIDDNPEFILSPMRCNDGNEHCRICSSQKSSSTWRGPKQFVRAVRARLIV